MAPETNLHVSVLALQRVRAAFLHLGIPPPTLLNDLPRHGWRAWPDPMAWLRDPSGQALAPAIRFQIGHATLRQWYHEGGGFAQCPTAVQVLRHHADVGRYDQVAQGPDSVRGQFRLDSLDEARGLATVHSSTPFCREWERGLIQGALDAAGDLLFSEVIWDPARALFVLRLVSEDNRTHIPWALGEPEEPKVWRLRNRVRQLEQTNAYLDARAQAVPTARGSAASTDWLDPMSGAAEEAHLAERLRVLQTQPAPPRACLIAFGLGHRPSPEALRTMGAAGLATTRRDDLLARLGEHDLALLLLDIEETAAQHVATRLAERLQAPLGQPCSTAVVPYHGGDSAACLALAKAALKARFESA